MSTISIRKYVVISILCHFILLLLLILGFDFSAPLPVLENRNKADIINAVVLGDSPKSKILPHSPSPPPTTPKQQPIAKEAREEQAKKEIIALKAAQKKKLEEEKKLAEKNKRELITKDLLADIEKLDQKQKQLKQKQLQSHFQKTLEEQAEKSLRQELLNEEIKLQSKLSKQAQGEVNKYKALILQAISENWLIPAQVNKKLYCELMIRLATDGVVLDVQITKTSGDPSLDSSARAAVLKASPLPVPADSTAFQAFKQFVLKVKPENILAGG